MRKRLDSPALPGRRRRPDFAFGSALNAAIERLSDSLAVELAPHSSQCHCPGIIDTPVWNDMVGQDAKAAIFADMTARSPAKRVGQPKRSRAPSSS